MEQNPTTKTPKVFISYAWTSKEHQDRVEDLATRLMNDGIDVLFDKWDLEPGQDKYEFMEKCVSDPDVGKVLMICDKNYQEKADGRSGGVGTETMIISPEVYDNAEQKKFIPIIFERDEDEEACVPVYIKSRLYFDMSENADFEDEYNKLVRCIYEKPLKEKPPLGAKPAFLDDTNINLNELRQIVKKFEKSKSPSASKVLSKKFLDSYVSILKEIHPEKFKLTEERAIDAVNKLKPVRDLYIDFLEACAQEEFLTADLIVEFLSKTYNEVCKIPGNQITGEPFADIRFLLWEMLLCSVSLLYSYQLFEQIYLLVCSPVYVRKMYFASDHIQENNITFFSCNFGLIEHAYRQQDESRQHLTKPLAVFLSTRETKPSITKETFGFSDILLWHIIQAAYAQGKTPEVWQPLTQVKNVHRIILGTQWASKHSDDTTFRNEWVQLSSTKFCSSILPLFGIDSIKILKESLQAIKKIKDDPSFDYGISDMVNILDVVPIEKIATRN